MTGSPLFNVRMNEAGSFGRMKSFFCRRLMQVNEPIAGAYQNAP